MNSPVSFSKRGYFRDPIAYIGIIKGLYRAPLKDYIGVILRNTHLVSPSPFRNYVEVYGVM